MAGIEVVVGDTKDYIVRKADGRPRWIRPVSRNEHGELPVYNINLLDIVEIENSEYCPDRAHSENVFYSTLKKSEKTFRLDVDILSYICDTQSKIFFNRGKAIPVDEFQIRDYSLIFVKVSDHEFYNFNYDDGKEKLRVKFSYNNIRYDLPVTDPAFINFVKAKSLEYVNAENNYYFTISLGEEFEGWHHKLVAGIIIVS